MIRMILPLLLVMMGCTKYQVVQKVRVNLYHLHHPSKGVEIILTHDELKIGGWYRLKQIETIDIENKIKNK
tara:strand:+ start:453 stop:665 length:213 start_codon:yes stop_codon:yes gene_type:complete